jgi:aryl-alcohol dehydrogenase-like predicted oxidoreductase
MIRTNLERSLRLLRTEVVDLYYLHHCDFGPGDEYFDDALALVRRFRDEGKVRFIGLSDWEAPKIMRFIDRVDPDVVQPYRNVVDDDFEDSGLRGWVEQHDAGVAFFSPVMHGLLLGKYEAPVSFPEGDFRSNVAGFGDAAVIARMRRARRQIEERWPSHPQPVLHALIGALLADAPTGCVLLGQRNPSQVASAAAIGEALSSDDAAWVRRIYREQ